MVSCQTLRLVKLSSLIHSSPSHYNRLAIPKTTCFQTTILSLIENLTDTQDDVDEDEEDESADYVPGEKRKADDGDETVADSKKVKA